MYELDVSASQSGSMTSAMILQPSSLVQHRVVRVRTLSAMMVPLLLSFLRRSSGRLKTAPTVQPRRIRRSRKASAIMVGSAVSAKSVEGQAPVSMAESAGYARSVEDPASALMVGGAAGARSVEGQASDITVWSILYCFSSNFTLPVPSNR